MVLMQAVDSDSRLLRALAGTRTRELLAWAAGISPGAIPQSVLGRAALVLADNIAATVGAQGEPEVRAAQAQFTQRLTASEATVFNRSAMRVDRYSAAAANGLGANWTRAIGSRLHMRELTSCPACWRKPRQAPPAQWMSCGH